MLRAAPTVVLVLFAIFALFAASYESPGEGRFVWDDDETVCPVFSGDLDVSGDLNMSGPARLDAEGCPEPDIIDFEGGMQLRKRLT